MPRFIALTILTLAFWPPTTAYAGTAGPKRGCNLPTSDAEALVILNNHYPGYWWDHTGLTIAVQAHPRATSVQIKAIHAAIDTWATVLEQCFDGLITLTDVTGTQPSEQRAADIVVHYVPTAGG